MYKVSVIVPVYGVEKYIERCVRSLFDQTLDKIEYIFVDDCTQDRSIDILQRLITEYHDLLEKDGKKVEVIRLKQNGGLPQARRHGIEKATGDYIIHCDSDDWIDKDMYRFLYEEAVKSDADMVACDYYTTDGIKSIPHKAFQQNINRDVLLKKMFSQEIPWMVWNKMFRAKFYKNPDYTVPRVTHSEDMAFCFQLIYYVERVSYVQKPLYYYMVNSNTALHQMNRDNIVRKLEQSIENVRLVEDFFKDKKCDKTISNGIVYLKWACKCRLRPWVNQRFYYELWKDTFPEIDNKILFNRDMKFKHKLLYFLSKCRISVKI